MMNEWQRNEWNSWVEIAAEDYSPAHYILRSDTLLAANAELKELRQQRDELLAALKKVMECIKTYTSVGATLRAKAAIAKTEGEKA